MTEVSSESTGMEDSLPETRSSPEHEMAEEGYGIPMEVLGERQVKPGDVVKLTVVNLDPENGTWTAKIVEDKPVGGAIDRASRQFEPSTMEMM